MKKIKEDPSYVFIRRFEKGLRIKDDASREEIIEEITSRIVDLERKGKDLEGIIEIMGQPEELASMLSNPENWFIDMGTPTSPLVPVESFISNKGRTMLIIAFLLALLLSSLMVITGEFGLLVPVILAFTITLWALMAAWLNQHLGYILTYKKMKDGKMKVSPISKNGMLISIWKHFTFSIILSFVLILSPLVFDRDSLFFSIPLGAITIIGSFAMGILISMEAGKVIDGK